MKKYLLLFGLLLAVSLSACGKVSAPEPIVGSGYPHTYPSR